MKHKSPSLVRRTAHHFFFCLLPSGAKLNMSSLFVFSIKSSFCFIFVVVVQFQFSQIQSSVSLTKRANSCIDCIFLFWAYYFFFLRPLISLFVCVCIFFGNRNNNNATKPYILFFFPPSPRAPNRQTDRQTLITLRRRPASNSPAQLKVIKRNKRITIQEEQWYWVSACYYCCWRLVFVWPTCCLASWNIFLRLLTQLDKEEKKETWLVSFFFGAADNAAKVNIISALPLTTHSAR